MDLWNRARVFAEEAAKRSQEISTEAAKRSQELTKEAARFSQGFVLETAKKSKELAAEASTLIRTEASKRAGQIKTLAGEMEIPIPIPNPIEALKRPDQQQDPAAAAAMNSSVVVDLERFGVTEELREFVKGVTITTFRDFPIQDEPDVTDGPPVSNIRQDLNEWQARHATLVLSTLKEISKFRYELCPRYMKERKFWRIYFILVNNFVGTCNQPGCTNTQPIQFLVRSLLDLEPDLMGIQRLITKQDGDEEGNRALFLHLLFLLCIATLPPMSNTTPTTSLPLMTSYFSWYEDKYFAESKLKLAQQEQDLKLKETETVASASNTEAKDTKLQSKTSSSSNPEHDLDVFLLGDLGSSDEDADGGGNDFEDDFDKIEDKVLDGEDDTEKTVKA